jgi:hypothetical protein
MLRWSLEKGSEGSKRVMVLNCKLATLIFTVHRILFKRKRMGHVVHRGVMYPQRSDMVVDRRIILKWILRKCEDVSRI